MFSVLILTYNEAPYLPECLESVSWCDDVVVLDSGSTDGTTDVAKAAGARVVTRPFDDFAGQRNFGIDTIDFKYDWVFHLDADEHFTTELKKECEEVIARDEHGAYLVPSKMIFLGKWLKRCVTYPAYQMRFHKLGDARFKQVGHGQRETELKRGLGAIKTPYRHLFFQKGLDDWRRKHVKYARDEAQEALSDTESTLNLLKRFSSSGGPERRRTLKRLYMRLPCRSTLKFFFVYVLKAGFTEGRAGLQYCRMLAWYERMIGLQMKELRQKTRLDSQS